MAVDFDHNSAVAAKSSIGFVQIVVIKSPMEQSGFDLLQSIGYHHNYYCLLEDKSCYIDFVGCIANHIFKVTANYFVLGKNYTEIVALVVFKIELQEMITKTYFYPHRSCFAENHFDSRSNFMSMDYTE